MSLPLLGFIVLTYERRFCMILSLRSPSVLKLCYTPNVRWRSRNLKTMGKAKQPIRTCVELEDGEENFQFVLIWARKYLKPSGHISQTLVACPLGYFGSSHYWKGHVRGWEERHYRRVWKKWAPWILLVTCLLSKERESFWPVDFWIVLVGCSVLLLSWLIFGLDMEATGPA